MGLIDHEMIREMYKKGLTSAYPTECADGITVRDWFAGMALIGHIIRLDCMSATCE